MNNVEYEDRASGQRIDGGSWKPKGPLERPPRSILIVLLSALGDAVLALPVITALRRTFPASHITWALQPGPHELVGNHSAVDHFIVFERGSRGAKGLPGAIREFRNTYRRLRAHAADRPDGRFDLLLDLQVYLKAGLLTALTPARVKVGFDARRSRDLNRLFTSHTIPPHPSRFGHIQDQYLEFLEYIGVESRPLDYGLHLSTQERKSQSAFFETLGKPACALVLSSSDPRKNWSPEGYADVATSLLDEFGLRPVLVGSRSPEEDEMARAILSTGRSEIVDARGGGIRRLLWLLHGSRLVISPDTGPLHMARAMTVPVVGLFGFTNPKRSGPYRFSTELIVDGYARFPGEDYPLTMDRRQGGMGRITPEMVKRKVALALKEEGARNLR